MEGVTVTEPTNTQIVDVLERIGDLLDIQEANPFRVRAYREAAQTISDLAQPVVDFIRRDDFEALKTLPIYSPTLKMKDGMSSGK
jgi:DNA polymerase (family X)